MLKENEELQNENIPELYKQSNLLRYSIGLESKGLKLKIFNVVMALWVKKQLPNKINDNKKEKKEYSFEEVIKRDRKIRINFEEFLNILGYNPNTNEKKNKNLSLINSKNKDELLNVIRHFNYSISYDLKESAPEEYEQICKLVKEEREQINKLIKEDETSNNSNNPDDSNEEEKEEENIEILGKPVFDILLVTTPTDDKRFNADIVKAIEFTISPSAIPLIDSISKGYTYYSVEAIRALKNDEYTFYSWCKLCLGSREEVNFKLYINPSETNPTNNLRSFFGCANTVTDKSTGEPKFEKYNRTDHFITYVVLPVIDKINNSINDIEIKYIEGSLKKNKKTAIDVVLKNKNIITVNVKDDTRLDKLYCQDFLKDMYQEFSIQGVNIQKVLQILESDKFETRHYNLIQNGGNVIFKNMVSKKENMKNEFIVQVKAAYLNLCFTIAKMKYKDKKTGMYKCNLENFIIYLLENGYDIFEGLKQLNSENDPRISICKEGGNIEIITGKSGLDESMRLFDAFWKEYPKKQGKANCEKWWKDNCPSESDTIQMLKYIMFITKYGYEDWGQTTGDEALKFCPKPLKFLSNKQWMDELSKKPSLLSIGYETNEIRKKIEEILNSMDSIDYYYENIEKIEKFRKKIASHGWDSL